MLAAGPASQPDLFGALPFGGMGISLASIDEILARVRLVTVAADPKMHVEAFTEAAAGLIATARGNREITAQTAATLARGLRELSVWAHSRGATSQEDLEDLASAWVTSLDLSRRGKVVPAAVDTQHRRRFVVDWIFRQARRAGLADVDPCADLVLQPRTDPERVMLADDEVTRLDLAATTYHSTRKPAVYAAAASGVPSDAIFDIGIADMDLEAHTITVAGRAFEVLPVHVGFLAAHRAIQEDLLLPGTAASRALYSGAASSGSQQAQVASILAEVGGRAGVVGLTASRLNNWAALRAFHAAGDHIEAAARLLGVNSLDTAAARIGWDWR